MTVKDFFYKITPRTKFFAAVGLLLVMGQGCPFSRQPAVTPVNQPLPAGIRYQDEVILPLKSAEIITPGFETEVLKPLKSPDGNFTLRTTTGFELTLTPDGKAKRVTLNKNEVVLEEPAAVFFATDVAKGEEYELAGLLTLQPDSLEFISNVRSNLQLRAKLQAVNDHVVLLGRLRGRTNEDRAVTLSFRLPFDFSGGQWWNDIQSKRIIEKGVDYLNETPLDPKLGYDIHVSDSPVSSVTMEKYGLAMAVPMSKPRVVRMLYSTDKGYRAEYDFGLAEETETSRGIPPNTADFELALFSVDPKYGLRDALNVYAGIYKDDVRSYLPANRVGTEAPGFDYASAKNIQDFDMGWVLAGSPEQAVRANKAGLLSTKYVMPNELWVGGGFPQGVVLAPEEAKNFYASLKDSVEVDPLSGNQYKDVFSVLPNSLMRDAEGKDRFFDWKGTPVIHKFACCPPALLFSGNGDPEVSAPSLGDRSWREQVLPAINDGNYRQIYNDRCGISTYEFANPFDYRRDHFRLAAAPLTFDPATKKPATLLPSAYVKFLQRERVAVKGAKTMICDIGDAKLAWWFAPQVDQLVSTVSSSAAGTGSASLIKVEPAKLFQLLRQAGFQKPVAVSIGSELDYEALYRQAALYGVAVGASRENPQDINKFRLAALKYLPLVAKLQELRWEPVTYASAGDDQVAVERYGSRPRAVAFVIYNQSDKTKEITINLDLRKLAMSGEEKVSELAERLAVTSKLVIDESQSITGRDLSVTLGAGGLAVLEIR